MSKVTIHFQYIPGWLGEFVDRCKGNLEYIVGVDVFPDVPGVKVLGRTYLPDSESNALVDQGVAGADKWIDKFAPVYSDSPHVDRWIGPNEYVLWNQECVDRFNDFHVRFIERMSILGHGVMCGQINTGWMRLRKYGDPPPYPESIAPMLAALWAHGGIFSVHEYGPKDMRNAPGNILRYRDFKAELAQAGIVNLPSFFISETGLDQPTSNPASDYGHWGWRALTFWRDYFDQLKWYSGELDKDSYVLGASIFTEGGGWDSFELRMGYAMELADFIARDEPPPPPPDRAKGLDVCRYQGDINWELVKADGYSFAMIRVSGPNNDRTDVEKDLRFETNYHGAGVVGLLRGGYHGLVPDFGGQAKLFVDAVGGRPLELGYWGDLENIGLTDSKCAANLLAVDTQIAEKEHLPLKMYTGVYTSPSFMSQHEGYWARGRKLWIAHWTNDLTLNPTVPSPWGEWEFWQWTNQGTDVPGVPNRTCLDVYNGTEAELYEEYKPENGGEEKMIEIVDRDGNPVSDWTWEDLQTWFGLSLTEAAPPDGATVFKLVRLIFDDSPETNWRLYVVDEDGKPLQGVAAFLGIQPPSGDELPNDAAPCITEDFCGQPQGRPNRALILQPNSLNFTCMDGYIQHSLGSGSNYIPPINGGNGGGTHWAWIMPGDQSNYSDVPAGFGMWNEHRMFWPVFQRQVVGENGNGGNGESVWLRVTGSISVDLVIEAIEE